MGAATAPAALVWGDALRLHHPQIDATHEAFVDHLAAVRLALAGGDDASTLAGFEALLAHSVEHFGQEDAWMLACGFAPGNCHARQHETVLQLMREVLRLARGEARWAPMRVLVAELGPWFEQHAHSMDAGLVAQMAAVGFDADSGALHGALPETPLAHCGGGGCR